MKNAAAFLVILAWLGCLLPGCGVGPEPGPPNIFTYTLDAQTREILEQLDLHSKMPGGSPLGRNFIGLFVPEKFLPYEPFVLGLATESSDTYGPLLGCPLGAQVCFGQLAL